MQPMHQQTQNQIMRSRAIDAARQRLARNQSYGQAQNLQVPGGAGNVDVGACGPDYNQGGYITPGYPWNANQEFWGLPNLARAVSGSAEPPLSPRRDRPGSGRRRNADHRARASQRCVEGGEACRSPRLLLRFSTSSAPQGSSCSKPSSEKSVFPTPCPSETSTRLALAAANATRGQAPGLVCSRMESVFPSTGGR
jgi:hypothetical protein